MVGARCRQNGWPCTTVQIAQQSDAERRGEKLEQMSSTDPSHDFMTFRQATTIVTTNYLPRILHQP